MSLGFRTSNIVPERLAEKVWFYKSQSLLLNIFTSVSVGSSPLSFLFPSATVRIPVYTAPRCSAELPPPGLPEAEPIRCVTIHFRDWHGEALLCYRNSTQITVLMCCRSLIRSDFRACETATRYSVNITAWIWMWTRQNAFLSLNTASLIAKKKSCTQSTCIYLIDLCYFFYLENNRKYYF